MQEKVFIRPGLERGRAGSGGAEPHRWDEKSAQRCQVSPSSETPTREREKNQKEEIETSRAGVIGPERSKEGKFYSKLSLFKVSSNLRGKV